MSQQNSKTLSEEVFKGTKWYAAMRWSIRGLGFISSAILARLLIPEDFGLVAIVLVIFGLVTLLFDFGVNWALVQNNKATDDHFDTAWTLRLFESFAIAIILAGSSSFIASSYGDIRLEAICQILAVGVLIRGFENIGTVKFLKEMRFSKDFLNNVVPKVISTFITIGLAFYYRSYMALVIGTVLHNLVVVIVSYIIVSFRPKFSFKKISEIWGFSQWVLVRNVAQYISEQGDLLLLAVFTTPRNIGFYKWGTELSFMAITEVQMPFERALISGMAKIKDDHDRLIRAYLKAMSMLVLVATPLALGFGGVANEFIPIFLGGGDKWLPIVPLVEGLVFFAMFTSLYQTSTDLLFITGNVKYTAFIFWIQALVTIATLYPAFLLLGLVGVVYARAFIGFIMFFVVSLLVVRKCRVAFGEIVISVWRPVVAGVMMYILLINISSPWLLENWLVLIIKIILGAALYVSFILILWWLAGKPESSEKTLLGLMMKKVMS
jgi:O-antigen/teichoic acid export membrane protein